MRCLLAVVGAAIALVATVALPATAQSGWTIESFDVVIDVAEDASFEVTEVIAVDFGNLTRHGIFRDIPVRYELPPDPPYDLPDPDLEPDDYLRALDIDRIRVDSRSAPDGVEITRPGPTGGEWLRIRVGDPDTTITGRHTYTIRYRVRGAFDRFERGPELFWNVTGNDWEAPIQRATAVVTGPPAEQGACFRGVHGASEACDSRVDDDRVAVMTDDLHPGEGMTLAVRYATDAMDLPPPLLEEKWTLGRAFTGSPWTIPLTILTALICFGLVGVLLYRQGRDRVARGTVTVDGRVDRGGAEDRRRGLFEPRVVAPRFRPPDGLRPGQLGVIVDETVDDVDVSATIVDLALRGYVRIEEIEEDVLWFSKTDWRLVRTDPAERDDIPLDLADRELLGYEQMLLDGLFAEDDSVRISDLKGTFHEDYGKVERAMYEDARLRRWFAKRPDKVRSQWLGIGVGGIVVGVGLLVAAVLFTKFALAAVPLLLAAVTLAVGHRSMPHRTAKGSQVLRDTLGFREFIATAEAERLRFAEAEDLFLPYLPYAVVFGETDRWAKAFADLGVVPETATAGWYVGHGPFHAARFSAGLSQFSSNVGRSLSTVPASSGSGGLSGGGFSGGGFGGGGGGSW